MGIGQLHFEPNHQLRSYMRIPSFFKVHLTDLIWKGQPLAPGAHGLGLPYDAAIYGKAGK